MVALAIAMDVTEPLRDLGGYSDTQCMSSPSHQRRHPSLATTQIGGPSSSSGPCLGGPRAYPEGCTSFQLVELGLCCIRPESSTPTSSILRSKQWPAFPHTPKHPGEYWVLSGPSFDLAGCYRCTFQMFQDEDNLGW